MLVPVELVVVVVVGSALPILDALEKEKFLAVARIWSLDPCACRFFPQSDKNSEQYYGIISVFFLVGSEQFAPFS
jgi:hypothetical protein